MKKISLFVLLTFLSFAVSFIGCKTEAKESIYISKQPNKTAYDFNSILDLTGIEIKGKYSDGTEKIIDGWSSNPKQGTLLSIPGKVTVIITYEDKTTSFTITVAEKILPKTLSAIYVSKLPEKVEYDYSSMLDLTGLEVKGRYSDGSESVLEGWITDPESGTELTVSGIINVLISYENRTTNFTVTVAEKPIITSNEYFWGSWVRIDKGYKYEVLETNMVYNDRNYKIIDSSNTTLVVESLGTFEKESDNVMVCNDIRYFRKGSANLEYYLKLVNPTPLGGSATVSGIKGKGKSEKYKNFECNSESDSEGIIKFTTPAANDTQIVEITNGDETIVVPGLSVKNSGDYMGTIALVGKNDCNLKITGIISDNQKDNGYLYGNNAKTYKMVISITNISENKCSTSACSIQSEDANLVIDSSDNTDLSYFTIQPIDGGVTKTIDLSVKYLELNSPYVDTGITVTIQNPFTGQEWKDFIPLRFFRGTIPVTIRVRDPENYSSVLNGLIIFPDGNNQVFTVYGCKPVFVPTFGGEKPYLIVFSCAKESGIYYTSEIYYTVEPASLMLKPVITSGSEILSIIPFGGENHSENDAYIVTEFFEAYVCEGEIDYYSIILDSDEIYSPDCGNHSFYSVNYVTEIGNAPDSFLIEEGKTLNSEQLPKLECEGYIFNGWYNNDKLVYDNSLKVNRDIKLTAKWSVKCSVNYVTEHGTAPKAFDLQAGKTLSSSKLPILTEDGWQFLGWYTDSSYAQDKKAIAGMSVTTDLILYAKWEKNYGLIFVQGGTVIGSSNYDVSANNPGIFTNGRVVTISNFYISDHELTQSEYVAIMENNPSDFKENPADGEKQENRPIDSVSWYDAIYFCNKYSESVGLTPCYSVNGNADVTTWNYIPHNDNVINETIIYDMTASGFRLPTEAEWEYAARGGQKTYGTTEFSSSYAGKNLDKIAWYAKNSDYITHEIKKKAPNALNLYDMCGNVSEWCWDWYNISVDTGVVIDPCGVSSGSEHVHRGGSYHNTDWACLPSDRGHITLYPNFIGFRLARSAETNK